MLWKRSNFIYFVFRDRKKPKKNILLVMKKRNTAQPNFAGPEKS